MLYNYGALFPTLAPIVARKRNQRSIEREREYVADSFRYRSSEILFFPRQLADNESQVDLPVSLPSATDSGGSITSERMMKTTELNKSHSCWWDSHISPKNSKWLAENLLEMEHNINRMLKLIDEEGDSFAEKAEMHYQKRPELVSCVEQFYNMYRSLAERYDHVTGELRKTIPSSLLPPMSPISDAAMEPLSKRPSSKKSVEGHGSGHRAAGFDYFLGSGERNSQQHKKDGEEVFSSLDSSSESDDSSVNNYPSITFNPSGEEMQKKINDLELKLYNMTRKLEIQNVEETEGPSRDAMHEVNECRHPTTGECVKELRLSEEKIWISEEEIHKSKAELQKYGSVELEGVLQTAPEWADNANGTPGAGIHRANQNSVALSGVADFSLQFAESRHDEFQSLLEELRVTKNRLQGSENEIVCLRRELESISSSTELIDDLQNQLELAQKELSMWKAKFSSERRETSRLQERIARYKTNLSAREQEIREMKVSLSDAGGNYYIEKLQLQEKMSKLIEAQNQLEEKLKEWEQHGRNLEEEIKRVEAEKVELEYSNKATEMRQDSVIDQLRVEICKKEGYLEDTNRSFEALQMEQSLLVAERDELSAKILSLAAVASEKDDLIDDLKKHLHELGSQHVEMTRKAEGQCMLLEELKSKAEELESEVERQRRVILEGAEEKREAIRQLCISIEHYRDGYRLLRHAIARHRQRAGPAL